MLLTQLKSQLHQYGLWAKKRLGQNFLVDEKALARIVSAAELAPDELVVEVGAGTGLLTTRLAPQCSHVTALEYDRSMIALLKHNVAHLPNAEVICEDALQFKIRNPKKETRDYKVVANIPYYITSPLIKHFLKADRRPSLIVLLTQKEVAEKVCATGKGKTVLTIETQIYGEPEIVAIVPRTSFFPIPQVDSAILRIRVFPQPKIPTEELPSFLKVVHAGFSQKRKKLTNSLAATLRKEPSEIRTFLIQSGIDSEIRAERLNVEEWYCLTKKIYG